MYSFSQIQIYSQCPLKFRYKYIDKIQTQEFQQTANLLLWKAVHTALEKYYIEYNNFNSVSCDQLIWYFNNYWDENFNENVLFDGSIDNFINRWRQYLSEYYDKYSPDGKIRIISTEENIVFNLTPNIKFQWYIDRLDKDEDTFVINDYKTNQTLPTQDKETYIEQLTLYGLWLQQKYWKYFQKIKARLYYLHFGILDEWEITNDNLQPVVNKYIDLVKNIEDSLFLYRMGNDKSAFIPQESSLCRFCDFQSICPLFVHQSYDEEIILGENTIRDIVDEYAKISNQINEMTKKKEILKDLIINYLNNKDILRVFGNEYNLTFSRQTFHKLLDKDKLYTKFKEIGLLDTVLEIDRFKVDKLLKDWEISLGEFGGLIEKSESITLRTSKK